MSHQTRIALTDTVVSAASKISEGNPGALRACMEMMAATKSVDPDSAMGGMAPILDLDTHGIYGSRIWMLYKDACKCNVVHALALLRSVQMGITPEKTLLDAIDNYGAGLDMEAILSDLQKRLPKFAAEVSPEALAEICGGGLSRSACRNLRRR